jgi:2,4-dienoyl-CoA reductase-like NADH-dependent reductase (Old Yellow Enzyme family)
MGPVASRSSLDQIKILNSPYTLPSGYKVENRLAKAAMTEHLADSTGLPNERHLTLYKKWAKSGAAFLLTGNVMVDRGSLEGIGNVVLDYDQPTQCFKMWADAVKENGGQLWMQIGHAGGLSICDSSLSPSGIQHIGKARTFPKPRPMALEDILDVIKRFAYAASVAKECGFAGVEIHSAHQFLLNQFLSPLTNTRTDEWGGALENRMKLLLEIVRAVRKVVGSEYPIAVKLNSSDGSSRTDGWTEDESILVCAALEKEGVDLLEISGGSYEATPMLGPQNIEHLPARPEAFFLEYAKKVRKIAPRIPIMLTAGMRSVDIMAESIGHGIVQVIGLGRPLTAIPDVPSKLLSGELPTIPRFYGESLPVFEQLKWFQNQMERIANGSEPDLDLYAKF